MSPQVRDDLAGECHGAPRPLRLGLGEHQARGQPGQGATDLQPPGVEVDVAPVEDERLTAAQARTCHKHPERLEAVAGGSDQDRERLRPGQRLGLGDIDDELDSRPHPEPIHLLRCGGTRLDGGTCLTPIARAGLLCAQDTSHTDLLARELGAKVGQAVDLEEDDLEGLRLARDHGVSADRVAAYRSLGRSRGLCLGDTLRAAMRGELRLVIELPVVERGKRRGPPA